MKCPTPITIKNPRAKMPGDFQYIDVPCKKCRICMKRRAAEWAFRLTWEEKRSTSAAFMTYTYDTEHLPFSPNGLPTLERKHHTDYMKRLRKRLAKDPNQLPLKYYAVGEYGSETQRPHYHAILFNLPRDFIETPEIIEYTWGHGIIQVDKVSPASIAYVTGYVNKQKYFTTNDPKDDRVKEFSVMSKKLGTNFLTPQRVRLMKQRLDPTIQVEDGRTIAIPQYFRKKALTEEEILILGKKSEEYFEENEPFKSEKHRIDYVTIDARNRLKNSKKRRKI